MKRFLEEAGRHPWYATHRNSGDLTSWPVLKKSDLYEKMAQGIGATTSGVYYSRSGGTTGGRPFFFPVDCRENHRQRRILARELRRVGVLSPQTVAVNILPIVRMYRSMEIFNEYCERCGATVLPMAAQAEDREIADIALQLNANMLIGMPSRMVMFARFLEDSGIRLSLGSVLFGGEYLQPGKREVLGRVLGVTRFSGVYGSAELGVIAVARDLKERPTYLFPKSLVHAEILSPDSQGFGKLVVTNLIRRRFPLIRFETGDIARLASGEASSVSVELGGREGDSFLIGDNYHSLAEFKRVLQPFSEFQILLRYDGAAKRDVIRFTLVEAQPLDERKRSVVVSELHRLLDAHEGMFAVEVVFAKGHELKRVPTSLKVPTILDERGR
ncbi:MAG: hypothetical protein HYR96_10545 [Deltaproteobacteria bacterium]|nr:hypothetical protein [Deltaproteobacteria bacterium]MBI3293566.1 hypothetical protein [Deltaproteobacteria bacterium]